MSDSGYWFCPKCNGRDSYQAYNDAIVRRLIHFCRKCDLEMLLSDEAFKNMDGEEIFGLIGVVILFIFCIFGILYIFDLG